MIFFHSNPIPVLRITCVINIAVSSAALNLLL